ncbi:hypothetical protein QBZ16_001293 [Prototheca wickerhamii]|uniref:Endoplasmic reticulum vesicle transporter C-terminal domain-containing protein n=1 Tax=Prototheca wickerhamii TaxID=3111 RepID=A0AAD9IGY3_PROWI|nr:hypothetical protein QBZ16_001293 [Prototheca wickerhamii]
MAMKVDTRRDEMLHIRFNISFPALPCNALVLDTGDSSGQYRSEYGLSFARNGEVHKWRLDASGRRLDRAEYHPPRAGGGNTAFPLNFDIGHDTMEAMRKAMVAHEGCLVYGWIAAQRVAGNLHLSVRPEAMFMSMNENEIIAALMSRQLQLRLQRAEGLPLLNASHAIHTLRFGEGAFPGQAFPLEGAARTDRLATGVDKYFIKVVPTTYFPGGWRRPVETQQYSVTEYYTRVDPKTDNKLPGLFFIYDTSPIAMDVIRTREGWLHFFVRFAAVVGGAFALTGAWDRVVHIAVQRFGTTPDGTTRLAAFSPPPLTQMRV